MTSQVSSYDLSISVDKSTPDYNIVGQTLGEWFKKFCFQKEEGETGYVHWQVRGSLIKKKRHAEMKKICVEHLWGAHCSITSSEVHSTNSFNYVLKADTRVEGPWKDEDFSEAPPLTLQLEQFMTFKLYPWQEQVLAWTKEIDFRSIKVIYDTIGNQGKSVFAEYLEYNRLAYEMPPFNMMEDLMQCAMGIKAQKAYLIDMPRAMKKDKLGQFYSGLEALKNGVMYDKRYAFKKRRINRPQIIVFTNTLPDFTLLSVDRWEVWEMQIDKSLKKAVVTI